MSSSRFSMWPWSSLSAWTAGEFHCSQAVYFGSFASINGTPIAVSKVGRHKSESRSARCPVSD